MNPLQIAATAGHLAGAACDMFLDWLAPLPEEASWPDGEQPLVGATTSLAVDSVYVYRNGQKIAEPPIEPPFTEDERVGLRQLLEERFGLALDDSSAADGARNGTRGAVAAEGPDPAEPLAAGSGRSNVVEISPGATLITKSLAISAAIGLREYAESSTCEAPVFWRSVADQLDPK